MLLYIALEQESCLDSPYFFEYDIIPIRCSLFCTRLPLFFRLLNHEFHQEGEGTLYMVDRVRTHRFVHEKLVKRIFEWSADFHYRRSLCEIDFGSNSTEFIILFKLSGETVITFKHNMFCVMQASSTPTDNTYQYPRFKLLSSALVPSFQHCGKFDCHEPGFNVFIRCIVDRNIKHNNQFCFSFLLTFFS